MLGVGSRDPEYVAARRVLLDALAALGEQRRAVILVGAQAVYLHVGEGDLAVSPYTTDGDLVIDPRGLEDEPNLVATMEAAGFKLAVRPGSWARSDVQIDLMVPASMGGPGRRGARLGAHGNEVARKATGLEAAVIDRSLFRIAALEPDDDRAFDIAVAGVAALLVAKLHKVSERKDDAIRRQDKDGLDILRLLRFAEPEHLGSILTSLGEEPVAADVTRQARSTLFADRNGIGSAMAIRACVGLEDETAIRLSCEVLSRRLLAVWT